MSAPTSTTVSAVGLALMDVVVMWWIGVIPAVAQPGPPVGGDVGDLLARVGVVDDVPDVKGYDRGCGVDKKTGLRQACVFGPAWNDPLDRSGCDTRSRVLREALRDIVFKPGTRDCKVVSGRLDPDPYTGRVVDLKDIQIDHVFALRAAWNAGAVQWDSRRRQVFANDTSELIAVSSAANQQKGESTLSGWVPPVDPCGYAIRYLTVAIKYGLVISVGDRSAALRACRTAG